MKKWLLVLGMITCILGASACGDEQKDASAWSEMSEEEAIYYGEGIFQSVRELCSGAYEEQKAQYAKADPVSAAAFSSWESAQADIGDYVDIVEKSAEINDDGIIVNLKVDGSSHDANIEIIFDDEYMMTSMSTNVIYSFSELMAKAFMNTLLGMGTVFAVLILIYGLISCFNFIPKLQKKFQKKPVEAERAQTAAKTVQPVVVEAETDDTELIAVIAAAIAASEGAASADGYVVRSIIRR